MLRDNKRKPREPRKFMMTLNHYTYKKLEETAKGRHITIQELLRAVVIPEYVKRRRPS